MALTDTAIKLAKSGVADRKLADGKGLYLLVTKTGSKVVNRVHLGGYPIQGTFVW